MILTSTEERKRKAYQAVRSTYWMMLSNFACRLLLKLSQLKDWGDYADLSADVETIWRMSTTRMTKYFLFLVYEQASRVAPWQLKPTSVSTIGMLTAHEAVSLRPRGFLALWSSLIPIRTLDCL